MNADVARNRRPGDGSLVWGAPLALGLCAVMMAAALGASWAQAQSAGLTGAWSGGGRVILSSGNEERASCRASFRQVTTSTFTMRALCATSSIRISQSGTLQRVAGNRFVGRFYNAEYNISGTANVSVRGNRMTASLRAAEGSATLALTRN